MKRDDIYEAQQKKHYIITFNNHEYAIMKIMGWFEISQHDCTIFEYRADYMSEMCTVAAEVTTQFFVYDM
jgi:hypothetical protein